MPIRLATLNDRQRLCEITQSAYVGYVSRIGQNPAPMDLDYDMRIPKGQVWVLDRPPVLGLIVMYASGRDWFVESIAVDPVHHGDGHGAALLKHAETTARRAEAENVFLYTNAAMTENLSFYPSLGYHETSRRLEEGFERVYFRKNICPQSITD